MSTNVVLIIVGVAVVAIIYFIIMSNVSKKINKKKGANGQFLQDDEMNEIEKAGVNYGIPLFEYRVESNYQGLAEKKPINFIEYEGGLKQQWQIFDHDSAIVRLDKLARLSRSRWQQAEAIIEGLEAAARSDEEASKILTKLSDKAMKFQKESEDEEIQAMPEKNLVLSFLLSGDINLEIPKKYLLENKEYAKAQKKAIKAIKPKQDREVYSTYAWDVCRLAALTKWSFWLGYISREEMDTYFAECSTLATEHGESWEEYGVSFLLGRTLDGFDIDDIAGETSYVVHKILEKQNIPF